MNDHSWSIRVFELLWPVQRDDFGFRFFRNPLCDPLYWWHVLWASSHDFFESLYQVLEWFLTFFLENLLVLNCHRRINLGLNRCQAYLLTFCQELEVCCQSSKIQQEQKQKRLAESNSRILVRQLNTIPDPHNLLGDLRSALMELKRPFWKSSLSRIQCWCLIYKISQIDNRNKFELHFLGGWTFGFINLFVNRLNEAHNDDRDKWTFYFLESNKLNPWRHWKWKKTLKFGSDKFSSKLAITRGLRSRSFLHVHIRWVHSRRVYGLHQILVQHLKIFEKSLADWRQKEVSNELSSLPKPVVFFKSLMSWRVSWFD